MFHMSVKSSEMLKKDPFSCEIQNDHTHPICQTMTLPGIENQLNWQNRSGELVELQWCQLKTQRKVVMLFSGKCC